MRCALAAVVALLLLAAGALADIPQMIGYQGMITDNGGNPVSNGTYTMRFRIYTAETGGSLLWDSNNQSVTLTGGVFNVMLGESPQPALGLAFDQDYWLLVTFAGQDQTPRKRLGSVGYAYMASGLVPGTWIEGEVYTGSSSVIRAVNTAWTGSNYGIRGENQSPDGVGVYGAATATTGTNYGGRFQTASPSGRGVYAYTTQTTGSSYGVYGWSYGTTGRGVYGRTSQTLGTSYGVYGESAGSLGRGVYGEATSTVSYSFGVVGHAASTLGYGVYGWAMSTEGDNAGVCGRCESDDGSGVRGEAPDIAGGWGVFGTSVCNSNSGAGVRGEGIYQGGVFVDVNDNCWCRVGHWTYKVDGNGTCNFVQNHPADAERVIVYTCPEGDEVATYTRGTARLVDGEARVPLGETFKWVTNPDIGLTAHLTPRGEGSVLYVESLSTSEMVVRSMEGFPGDIVFDYLVYGLRIGFEEVTVVQQKQEEAYIPSMEDHRQAYAEHSDLRQYNALERFRSMNAAAGLGESMDLSASRALRDAIEEYDLAVHGPVGSGDHPELRSILKEERRRLEEERARNEAEAARVLQAEAGVAPSSPVHD